MVVAVLVSFLRLSDDRYPGEVGSAFDRGGGASSNSFRVASILSMVEAGGLGGGRGD